jgi:hypothetical protein
MQSLIRDSIWAEKLYQALRPPLPQLGNLAFLSVPELAHPSTYSWIRPQMFSLRTRHPFHLATAIRCAYMAMINTADIHEVASSLLSAPLFEDHRLLQVSGDNTGPSTLQGVLGAIFHLQRDRDCYLVGIDSLRYANGLRERAVDVDHFLRAIVFSQDPFDVTLFLDLFEDLISDWFVSYNLGPVTRSGVTLPRSWSLAAVKRNPTTRSYSIPHCKILVDIGQEYIHQLLRVAPTGAYSNRIEL